MGENADPEPEIRRIGRSPADASPTDVDRLLAGLDDERVSRRRAAALALATVAEHDPELLRDRVAALGPHLDDDPQVRGMVVQAVAAVATASPGDAAAVVEDLRPCLDPDFEVTAQSALTALRAIATADPSAAAPLVQDVAAVVGTDPASEATTTLALSVLRRVLPAAPVAVASVTPDIVGVVERVPADGRAGQGVDEDLAALVEEDFDDAVLQRVSARKLAAVLLARVAEARPAAVAAHVDRIAARLDDPDLLVRQGVTDALYAVANARPGAAAVATGPLVDCLQRDDEPDALRGRAAGTLASIATAQPDAIASDAATLVPVARTLLARCDAEARAEAAGLLAALAGVRPATTRDAIPDLRSALDDDRAVRVRAILALQDLRATGAREDLRRVRDEDPDPAIRELAGDALDALPDA